MKKSRGAVFTRTIRNLSCFHNKQPSLGVGVRMGVPGPAVVSLNTAAAAREQQH